MIIVLFALSGLPFSWCEVEVDEQGITQRLLGRRAVARWADIISWQRVSHPDGDGPDTITITTRSGSFALNHNCVYGKRLDFVESELRHRIAPRARCSELIDDALGDHRESAGPKHSSANVDMGEFEGMTAPHSTAVSRSCVAARLLFLGGLGCTSSLLYLGGIWPSVFTVIAIAVLPSVLIFLLAVFRPSIVESHPLLRLYLLFCSLAAISCWVFEIWWTMQFE